MEYLFDKALSDEDGVSLTEEEEESFLSGSYKSKIENEDSNLYNNRNRKQKLIESKLGDYLGWFYRLEDLDRLGV